MLVVVFHILTETVLNKLKANLSRKSFLTLCLASILSACASRRDLMSINEKDSQIAIAYTLWSLKKGAGIVR